MAVIIVSNQGLAARILLKSFSYSPSLSASMVLQFVHPSSERKIPLYEPANNVSPRVRTEVKVAPENSKLILFQFCPLSVVKNNPEVVAAKSFIPLFASERTAYCVNTRVC